MTSSARQVVGRAPAVSDEKARPRPTTAGATNPYRRIWAFKKHAIWAVLLLGVALRLYQVQAPLIDSHSYRQTIDAMMARNFVRHGFNPFYPRVDYGTSQARAPQVYGSEFPLYPLLVSGFYRWFGVHESIGRGVTIAFSILAAALLFALARRYFGSRAGLFAALFFTLSPLSIYYGRTFQRNMMHHTLMAAVLFGFSLWMERRSKGGYALALGSFSLAALMNLPNLYLMLPLLAIAWQHRGKQAFKDPSVYALFILPSLLAAAWYIRAARIAVNVAVPMSYYQIGDWQYLTIWLSRQALKAGYFLTTHFVLGPIGCIFFVLGALRRTASVAWVWAWVAAVLIYFALDPKTVFVHPHDYYYLHLLFPLAILGGLGMEFLLIRPFAEQTVVGARGATAFVGVLLLLMGLSAWTLAVPFYRQETEILEAAKKVRSLSTDEDLVVTGNYNPNLLYCCDRRGWRLRPEVDTWTGDLRLYRRLGARYFVTTEQAKLERNPELSAYLTRTGSVAAKGEHFIVYRLKGDSA